MARKLTLTERNRRGGKARWADSTAKERAAFARKGQRAAWASLSPAERQAAVARMLAGKRAKAAQKKR